MEVSDLVRKAVGLSPTKRETARVEMHRSWEHAVAGSCPVISRPIL